MLTLLSTVPPIQSVQTVMMDVIKVQGTAVIVGSYKKPPEVDLLKVEFKELTIIGIRVYERRDFEIAIQILERIYRFQTAAF